MKRNEFNSDSGDYSVKKSIRLTFLTILIILIFFIYAYQLFSLQIIEGQKYRNQSIRLSSTVTTIASQRGEIFDRKADQPLAVNTDSFAVDIVPGEIPSGMYDTVVLRLADYLGVSKTSLDRKIPESYRKSFASIEVKTNVPFDIISNIAENITDLPGVSWRNKPIRTYTQTGSISHVLGYVGDITREELNVMYNQGYTRNSIIGKSGIEKQYDKLLQGVNGRISRTIDARGRVLDSTPIIEPPQMGKNLVLTIDTTIQTLVEKALGDRVGASIVLKPASGEILAMVSYPYFDANIFSTGADYGTDREKLLKTENNPLLNRAVNAVYPPASTFKTIMATALLSENYPSDKKIECPGRIIYGDRTFRCHVGLPGHGWLDLKNALAQSCDVYFWVVGRDTLGVDKIAAYAQEFGFGRPLQIDLPSPSDGFVPTAMWKENRFHEKWLGGDTMNMSIGQGYTLVTPLHVANMMAMVCNSGKIYKPHLLKEVRDPGTNEVIESFSPEVMLESTIDKNIWKEVQNDLRYTITDGTAVYPMHNKIVKIAGKTGTAEVNGYAKNHWHSWMIAYAPYDAPPEDQVVVVTLVEAVNTWEWWAPYATNIIIQGIFANQSYDEAVNTLGFRYILQQQGRRE